MTLALAVVVLLSHTFAGKKVVFETPTASSALSKLRNYTYILRRSGFGHWCIRKTTECECKDKALGVHVPNTSMHSDIDSTYRFSFSRLFQS